MVLLLSPDPVFGMLARERQGHLQAPARPVSPLHEAVAERLHEAYQRIFLFVRKPEPPHELGVHIVDGLWHRPARRTLAGVIGGAAPQDVARVVEVHDRLEALEVTIVSVGFNEAGIGSLVHIAQRWRLKSPHCSWLPAGAIEHPPRKGG